MKFNCPRCGAPGNFENAFSMYYTCPYCRQQVFRNNQQIETMGQVAELPADASPLQLYSQGEVNKKKFKVIGRIKLQWEEGHWNEWYLSFTDGAVAWLAEAQGEFIYSGQVNDLPVDQFSAASLGKTINYFGLTFKASDYKETISYGFEGELPYKIDLNEKRKTLDFFAVGSSRFLSFEEDVTGRRAYLGQYMTLQELKMTQLRRFDGWTA